MTMTPEGMTAQRKSTSALFYQAVYRGTQNLCTCINDTCGGGGVVGKRHKSSKTRGT